MEIRIYDAVGSDSMGDGWDDAEQTAKDFAEFLSGVYREAAASEYPGAEIEVEVACRNNMGTDLAVNADSGDDDGGFKIEIDLKDHLYSLKNRAWEDFCSEQAD